MGIEEKKIYVSKRIEDIILLDKFKFDIDYLKYIHGYLFDEIYDSNGEFRTCNLTKREFILNGDTVIYADFHNIYDYLVYDMEMEKKKDYRVFNRDNVLKNISDFTSRLWQIHPFIDGNTRSVSIFIQQYLNYIGYAVSNDSFKDNYLYFRNALVLANYYNRDLGIRANMEVLIDFFYKIIYDRNYELNFDAFNIPILFSNERTKVRKK